MVIFLVKAALLVGLLVLKKLIGNVCYRYASQKIAEQKAAKARANAVYVTEDDLVK